MTHPQTQTSAIHERDVRHDLLGELRAHGKEWLSGTRDQKAAAEALARVEQILLSASKGPSFKEAPAQHDDDVQDEGEDVELTNSDVLDLRAMAEQNLENTRHMLARLRDSREMLLAGAVDRESALRWIESTEANLLASEQYDARQLANYREVLKSPNDSRWKLVKGAHGG